MKIGFIGLGNLGTAMAKRLIEQGFELVIWNRTLEKCEGLGAEIVLSPAAVVSAADITVLNLFDTSAVLDVLWMENGILSADMEGKLIIDTSTNHFGDVFQLYDEVESMGGMYLEAPVLGSTVPASKGQLVVLASGSAAAYEKARPVLDAIGRKTCYLEKEGAASKVKVINNMLLGVFCASIAEAAALGEKAGINKGELLDILAEGAGKSLVMDAKKDKIKNSEFSAQFSGACIFKDMGYLQSLAHELHTPLYTGSIVKELYGEMFRKGIADEDFSAIYKIFSGG
jgi:3-hydroxyisobutyrate dehydrogenase